MVRNNSSFNLVAYQGVPGAFGEAAIDRVWGGTARSFAVPTFDAALAALRDREVMWAVIPVWNSSVGEVLSTRDALAAHADEIEQVHEVEIPVQLALMARPGASFSDLRFVGSQPTALAQCTRMFGEAPALQGCNASNTAGAARDLASYGRVTAAWYATLPIKSSRELAVVASERAARRYGLCVLRRGVQDDPNNRTRFAVFRKR